MLRQRGPGGGGRACILDDRNDQRRHRNVYPRRAARCPRITAITCLSMLTYSGVDDIEARSFYRHGAGAYLTVRRFAGYSSLRTGPRARLSALVNSAGIRLSAVVGQIYRKIDIGPEQWFYQCNDIKATTPLKYPERCLLEGDPRSSTASSREIY